MYNCMYGQGGLVPWYFVSPALYTLPFLHAVSLVDQDWQEIFVVDPVQSTPSQ